MPVGQYPIAETIIRQLRFYGVREVTFAVGYLHQLLEAYFGDGSAWDLHINYLREELPLGTAGPLAQLREFDEPLLVMNGDILCDLDFSAFYRAHLDSGAEISIAAYSRSVNIDFGVLRANASHMLEDYIEKPSYDFQVSMGIYAISPSILPLITPHERCDFPDLVKALLQRSRPVKLFPFDGIWLDIGRGEDYQAATEVFEQNQSRLLPAPQNIATGRRVSTASP